MNNLQDILSSLDKLKTQSSPCVSLYLPLKGTELSPERMLSALVNNANQILRKNNCKLINENVLTFDNYRTALSTAIFWCNNQFIVVPLPMILNPRIVVARSFHIKPLFAASIAGMNSFLVHFDDDGAGLYKVTSSETSLIKSFQKSKGYLNALLTSLKQLQNGQTEFVGVSGSLNSTLLEESLWSDTGLLPVILPGSKLEASVEIMKFRLARQASERFKEVVNDITSDVSGTTLDHGLPVLGERIMNGKIKRLCVSLDDLKFGHLDPATGVAAIHRVQKNAHDDDVLDDLLELALKHGVRVSAVPKTYLPTGKTFIAS